MRETQEFPTRFGTNMSTLPRHAKDRHKESVGISQAWTGESSVFLSARFKRTKYHDLPDTPRTEQLSEFSTRCCSEIFAFWVSKWSTGESGGYVGAGGPGFLGSRDLPGRANP